ncbi:hydroxylase for synthesis of 2-methylthio-cis-ribozeatin in tRNA [gamma proteobacterium HIMB55]|nr:hydroxylase for synthesis of 2-methylthio-cis-ribozeatin in tRNA [gamma proteobacterium HIMB55]
MPAAVDLSPVYDFLPCRTPEAWLSAAVGSLPLLMIDHANCEKKAAATAMSLMHRYTDNTALLNKMSRLAREELRHFELVLKLMTKRGIAYESVTASRYAQGLREKVRKKDPHKLVDTLIVGALIEARSCERFAALSPHVDSELSDFYVSLLKSESRHFMDYITLAKTLASPDEVDERLSLFSAIEQSLIEGPDTEIRFHSGVLQR